ncbi:unnamed protein product [Urochloa decumbens]|uniref:NB-ARC domain-containing protein n=1 Tax=Urochloa decumbens TaxID=240449 RepID=A0ABC9GFR1_9POAL
MAEAAALAFAKSAAIFMGKTAAGPAISYLVNKALGRLAADDEDLCRSLTAKLPIIEAVFGAGDQLQGGEHTALRIWLWQFRDAMQEAEDALDVLEILDLEKKVKEQRSQEAKDSRVKAKLHGCFLNIVSSVTGGTIKSLKDALKTLDSVLDNAEIFLLVIRHRLPCCSSAGNREPEELANRHETTRELTTTVFGRQKEKDAIVEWLGIETTDTLDHTLSVCAIVGGGGMGKTTLAQFICQDTMVQDHFGNMIIWVHVSKSFDPKMLVKRILESIKWDKSSAEALDSLQSDLTKQLATSRFLLVLDDAWEDTENQRWEQFLGPLRNNALMGGKILLTTRMRSVADAVKHQMPAGYKLLVLEGLDQEDTVKLFNHHVFGESVPNYCWELQLIGEQIAKKLKGCPFVAKVIGQQLRDSTDLSRWNTILNQDIHQIDEIVPTIMEMLRLSYQNLTSEVQLCFRFCSIFPPHYKFKVEEVIEMSVSSGLILQRENGIKNQEDIAREHFNVLSRKSFFSMVPRELHADPSEDYYVLHDLMYELACFVSSDECSRFKDGDHESDISPRVRYLYIQGVNFGTAKVICQSKYLRTLIIENDGNSMQEELLDGIKKAVKCSTSLRLLKFCGHGWFGMNDAVAELKRLRYIYISVTDEPNLCKLFKLYHLEVLQIIKIEKEEKVSSIEIDNLPCLRKLYLPKDTLSKIPHIGRLCTLREVNGFSVRKKDGHRITELRDLRNLWKIIVLDVQNVSNCNEAYAAKLDNKSNLKALSLGWSDDQYIVDAQILNKLVPHRNLKHLIISGYNGIQPPIWMEPRYLSNLVHLKLDGCAEWNELPPLDSLKALKHVLLAHLPKLKYITSSSYGYDYYGYRENRTKRTCPGRLPPHLFTFVVKDCPQLSKLPVLPFSLQFLGIDAVGILRLPTMSDQKAPRYAPILEPQLSVLFIESCRFLVSLDGCFIQEEHYKALTVLKLF